MGWASVFLEITEQSRADAPDVKGIFIGLFFCPIYTYLIGLPRNNFGLWSVKPQMKNDTVMIASFRTERSRQTVDQGESDQGLHCLQFRLHLLDALLYDRATCTLFEF